jgi:hypothetical protein
VFLAIAAKYAKFQKLTLSKWRAVPQTNADAAMAAIDDLDDAATLNQLRTTPQGMNRLF